MHQLLAHYTSAMPPPPCLPTSKSTHELLVLDAAERDDDTDGVARRAPHRGLEGTAGAELRVRHEER
jgi:hypothetical protein